MLVLLFCVAFFIFGVQSAVPKEEITDPVLKKMIFDTLPTQMQENINRVAVLFGVALYHELDDICVYVSRYHGNNPPMEVFPPGRFTCPIMANSTTITRHPVTTTVPTNATTVGSSSSAESSNSTAVSTPTISTTQDPRTSETPSSTSTEKTSPTEALTTSEHPFA